MSVMCGLLWAGLALLFCPGLAQGRRMPEYHCQGGGTPGDKWFDGCQWCVCTTMGKVCSQSQCSTGLVRKVAPCHVLAQRWVDGCYHCTCKRHGIACRLDLTCRLLRHSPVPCLADDRCVCGPDGVPSCTAEVIDRSAFAARRVDLGLSAALLAPEVERVERRLRTGDLPGESTTQELLITSDNLCRFGPRWYGGSLRCYCDLDGSVSCGNPAFITAFFDDFKVRAERCEEGHAWEEGCSVCSCRVSGAVFCRTDRQCRSRLLHTGPLVDRDGEGDDYISIDHVLNTVNNEYADGEGEMMLPLPPYITHPPPRAPEGRRVEGEGVECEPGHRWREVCRRCRCTPKGRAVCRERHCGDNNSQLGMKGEDEEGVHKQGPGRDHQPGAKEDPGEGENQETSNRAFPLPPLSKPASPVGPRGPMITIPVPPGVYQPPAYADVLQLKAPCGRFQVGDKYWQDCNLCLCTPGGPKCEGKLCQPLRYGPD